MTVVRANPLSISGLARLLKYKKDVTDRLKLRRERRTTAIPARASYPANDLFTRRIEMKRFVNTTVLSVILVMVISTTAFAGHIAGGRAAGHIAGGRAAGHIAGGRATGNIPGGRASTYMAPSSPTELNAISRVDFEGAFYGTFNGLIRMLLESGALL
jgi:hypothetical protein